MYRTLWKSSLGEGWTSLNDVSSAVGRKEGWTDSRLYLSLINLSNGVEKCLYLINKRDTAYAFPHKLASGRRRCKEGQRYLGLDGGREVELGPQISSQSRIQFSPVCNGQSLQELTWCINSLASVLVSWIFSEGDLSRSTHREPSFIGLNITAKVDPLLEALFF